MTVQADGESWSDVVSAVCMGCGVGVVLPDGDDPPVTLSVVDASLRSVLEDLGRRRDLYPSVDGGMIVWLPASSSSDQVSVMSTGWLPVDQARTVVEGAMNGSAQVREAGPGLIVVGDRRSAEGSAMVSQALEDMRPGVWVFDVWVLEVTGSVLRSYEAAASSTGTASVVFDGSFSAELSGLVQAAWNIGGSQSEVRGLQRGSIIVIEGEYGEWNAGEVVPVPQRTVSPYGVVTTSGYDYVQTGYNCKIDCWRTPEGCGVALAPEVSKIVGYVDDAPIVARRRIDVSATLQSGDWLMLSGLDAWQDEHRSAWLGVGETSAERSGRILFLMRARSS